MNEIRIWAELNHKYVLSFLGFLAEGEGMLPSLISELMERGTVDVYMQNFPRGGEETWSMVDIFISRRPRAYIVVEISNEIVRLGLAHFNRPCLPSFEGRSSCGLEMCSYHYSNPNKD